jgi:hemerythrin superfamily protein
MKIERSEGASQDRNERQTSALAATLHGEHADAMQLVERLTRNVPGDDRAGAWRDLYVSIAAHSDAEEETVYRRLREALPAGIEQAVADHDGIREILDELQEIGPFDPQFPTRLARLRAHLLAHVREEEETLLPRAEATFDGSALDAMAREFAERRQAAADAVRDEG